MARTRGGARAPLFCPGAFALAVVLLTSRLQLEGEAPQRPSDRGAAWLSVAELHTRETQRRCGIRGHRSRRPGCDPGRMPRRATAEDGVEGGVFGALDGLYVEPVFRPPAEAGSLILQVTNGCSWNRCSFCEMYTAPQKAFRAKPLHEVTADLRLLGAVSRMETSSGAPPPRIFLADGDAMSLPASRLREILEAAQVEMPDLARVSSYCLPRNLRTKSVDDLRALHALGLRTLYVGCESGDDEVLRRVGKGETRASSLEALQKLRAAGLKSSVMILHGLGGRQLSRQHAESSAALMSEAQPDLLSTLVVSFPLGMERHAEGFADLPGDGFQQLEPLEILDEMTHFIERLDLRKTIFRSDHASNYLSLKGVLGRDRPRLLAELAAARRAGPAALTPEWARGL
mmetsp:Transcript_37669/g.95383  ORF Transcript_37669/g.95383 Transcript_37669/m.95383 type:complete len:401 (+) Transcript_37669:212-1414(+)|eukprot:CAMPEP_0183561084 /NCGR_PEP_ID=MMETSP0371-20130417/96522_1 /TAXON_ID=268820 /ORGANISM="Peridinium aciculiferum, Strain PAER-2" /LENGTH=400 /DNA_ID=CAMNT_0025769505 /DNA_START=211 /DNA_END=1413 /DNA_ORIENTATION=-